VTDEIAGSQVGAAAAGGGEQHGEQHGEQGGEPDLERARAGLRAWLGAWGAEVAAVDLAAARHRFSPDMTAFGTRAEAVRGRDRVEAEQWSPTWPAIEDFRFLADRAQVELSADRLMAVIAASWTSTGIAADGGRFERPGRATIVLRREGRDAEWLGVHTHFSLTPGVPQTTHGDRPARR
jgi:ketosteroid isomerase-like protein